MEIAIVGAGSHFTLHLLRSLYQTASHDDYHLRLMDLRSQPLDSLGSLLGRLNALTGRRVRYSCHRERASALEGAEHVLVSFAVDFPASFLRTCWVMHNHGIRFVEGETATPGALMATLRHLPPLLGIAGDVRRYSDGAWLHVINNPMPRLILGVLRGTGYDRVVGHCHGTIQTRERIGTLTDTPPDQIDLFVAGINHFHLVQRAVDRRDGRDLLEILAHLPEEKRMWWEASDFTQWRLYRELGDLLGCGHWHNFDYVPYSNTRLFRHADDNTWERHCLAVQSRRQPGTDGEIGSHLADQLAMRAFLDTPEHEQMFHIMRALSREAPPYYYLAGNMPNAGHVPNLPDGAVVELPSTVTPDGVVMHRCQEPLPRYFETWVRQQLTVHELSVRAALENSRRAAVEAIACDPSFRDCDCPPGQLLDEMLAANQGLVPRLD
jgi:alpha-galactosidase